MESFTELMAFISSAPVCLPSSARIGVGTKLATMPLRSKTSIGHGCINQLKISMKRRHDQRSRSPTVGETLAMDKEAGLLGAKLDEVTGK